MNGCNVCLVAADDVANDFYREANIRAVRSHECCECRRHIPVGVKYQRATGKSEGEVWTFKTCAECAEIRKVFYCGGQFYFTLLWEDMQEQAFPHLTTASECFRELSPESKAFVLERWTAWRGLNQGMRA